MLLRLLTALTLALAALLGPPGCLCANKDRPPSVMIALLARNKAHVLPLALTRLGDLDYPKERVSLYVRSDHNADATLDVLGDWLDAYGRDYHSLNVSHGGGNDEVLLAEPAKWTEERFRHVMRLKEEALEEARRIWADYVWFLDADAFITNSLTLEFLVGENDFVVAAPLLRSVGLYSNFWAGMDQDYYYQRTDAYLPILDRKELECFDVPMVHSCFLVNLRKEASAALTFLPEKVADYDGPLDDIIVFALSARKADVSLYVCNHYVFGYIALPMSEEGGMEADKQNFLNLDLEMTADRHPPTYDPIFEKYQKPLPQKDKLGVDEIYMINLERRPDRKQKMDHSFDLLGIEYEWVKAVDGRTFGDSHLADNGITMLPSFSEPYHGRPLTYGEIGCFMSHYNIWRDVIEKKHESIIVFEDDIRFEPYFREKVQQLRAEVEKLSLDWDLIFLGRKILHNTNEPWVEGSSLLVDVDYTYWTLSYLLSQRGARKLVDAEPLSKMVPVDEYLPIMYDKHPNATWKESFVKRDLKAYSVHPLFVNPTHYTGEDGYISDTEATPTIASSKEESDQKDEL